MKLLRGFILICFFIVVAMGVQLVGPRFEKWLLPVLNAGIEYGEVDGTLEVYIVGQKLRSCQLQSADWSWRFGKNSILPTSVTDVAGKPTEIGRVLQQGDIFRLGPYYVVIPTAVRAATNPVLAITWYYSCHRSWLTEYDLSGPVDLLQSKALTQNLNHPTVAPW